MISNVQYLIQRYAEAREKMQDANTENGRFYWKGSMETYHAMLNESFDGWAVHGTVATMCSTRIWDTTRPMPILPV